MMTATASRFAETRSAAGGVIAGRTRALAARVSVVLLVLLGALAHQLPAQVYARSSEPSFPHLKHAKLFPTCTGCHAGATTGDEATTMPSPATCTTCHDGRTQRRVAYTGAPPRHDFLRFVHRDHATRVEPAGRSCATCHATTPDAAWMDVRRAPPESCMGCHTHRAGGHLAPDSRCAICHTPVAQARTLSAQDVAALPTPPSHAMARFLVEHNVRNDAEVAQCATCHSRESCARCHVNAADVAAINQLLPDARVAAMLRGKSATYLTPDDHRSDAWEISHGRSAEANIRRCAACHAQPSCTVCHTGAIGSAVIRRLPDGRSGTPGVQLVLPRRTARAGGSAAPSAAPPLVRALPVGAPHTPVAAETLATVVRPHPVGFERQHAASAASGRLTCDGCHARRFCTDCHAGESRRNFHPADFVARHAPESYGREMECSSCHNTEVFCRSCHQAQGIAASGQGGGSYHNGQPLWLLQHGEAARRGLQSCATCHQQRGCLRCHSQRGWGVNPHGPGFNAERVGARARVMCARCHLTDPTGRR